MATTVLGNVVEFFGRLGIFDVMLPFLLVFTMMFAVLERTRVFGTETNKAGKDQPRKNLNAMTAFVIAFLVLASSKIVEAITSISSHMILLVMLGVFFLLTIGAFYKEGELGKEGLPNGWMKTLFLVIMLIGIIVIFMNAIKNEDGDTWWDYSIDYLDDHWDSTAVASIALIILVIAFMMYITHEKAPETGGKGG